MTHSDIISRWPSVSAFASDIGVEYGTAKAMRRRSSIPPGKWVLVVEKAAERGIAGVTYEALALAAADVDDAARESVEGAKADAA